MITGQNVMRCHVLFRIISSRSIVHYNYKRTVNTFACYKHIFGFTSIVITVIICIRQIIFYYYPNLCNYRSFKCSHHILVIKY